MASTDSTNKAVQIDASTNRAKHGTDAEFWLEYLQEDGSEPEEPVIYPEPTTKV
jgi:hypothetical protein